eukprot:6286371-Prymnesium_polylepis.1
MAVNGEGRALGQHQIAARVREPARLVCAERGRAECTLSSCTPLPLSPPRPKGEGGARGGQAQHARAAQVGQVDEAAQHVQARIHRPHAKHAPTDTDDVLRRRDRGSGVNVVEEVQEQRGRVFLRARLHHLRLVLLLNVGQRVRE